MRNQNKSTDRSKKPFGSDSRKSSGKTEKKPVRKGKENQDGESEKPSFKKKPFASGEKKSNPKFQFNREKNPKVILCRLSLRISA